MAVIFIYGITLENFREWSGGASVLDKVLVPGCPTNLDNIRVTTDCACDRYEWGLSCLDSLSLIYHFLSFLPLSLSEKTVIDTGRKDSVYDQLNMRVKVLELKVKNWHRVLIFQNFLTLSRKPLCNMKLNTIMAATPIYFKKLQNSSSEEPMVR